MLRRTFVVFSVVAALLSAGCATSGPDGGPERLSAEDVARVEAQAAVAREAFWQGRYEDATETLTQLAEDFTTSQPLYLCELGAVTLVSAGHTEDAFGAFQEAYRLLEGFYDARSEEKAVSLWGAESEKVYKGDPYERCMLSLLLGLTYLDRQDVDNALACAKNGQLADSDVTNELYQCDFGLLQLLEGKCYELRDQPEMADAALEAAMQSFVTTHPRVRDAIAKKQSVIDAAAEIRDSDKISKSETIRLASLEAQTEELQSAVEAKSAEVDLDYIDPLLSDYNTLLLVWAGVGPAKMRYGQYGENRAIVPSSLPGFRSEVCVNGTDWHDAIQGFSDVTFQGTTRGGRVMDDVLRDQAAFKAVSDQIGDAFIDAADDVGGYAGLAMILIGITSKAISAAAHAEADIRCWRCLPDSIDIVPLNLSPGVHEFKVEFYDRFLKVDERGFTAKIDPEKRLNLIWSMPLYVTEPPI